MSLIDPSNPNKQMPPQTMQVPLNAIIGQINGQIDANATIGFYLTAIGALSQAVYYILKEEHDVDVEKFSQDLVDRVSERVKGQLKKIAPPLPDDVRLALAKYDFTVDGAIDDSVKVHEANLRRVMSYKPDEAIGSVKKFQNSAEK